MFGFERFEVRISGLFSASATDLEIQSEVAFRSLKSKHRLVNWQTVLVGLVKSKDRSHEFKTSPPIDWPTERTKKESRVEVCVSFEVCGLLKISQRLKD